MALTSKGIFVVGAKRTPFCKYGGSLRELPACHAFAGAAKEALDSANFNPQLIDCTIVGNVNFLSQCDGGKTPRYCGTYSGVPLEKPALGVNKACGTGLQAIITGVVEILSGSAKTCLTGGTELMSSLPLLVRNVRFGTTIGKPYTLEDHIKNEFVDSYSGLSLQRMAEDIALKYKLDRKSVDQFAYHSFLKWKTAQETNSVHHEIASITTTIRRKEMVLVTDELPDNNLNLDKFSNAPAILEDGNIVTPHNTSAPADGAAALVLADEDTISNNDLKPLARVTGWACVGVDPVDTGLAAVPAIEKLLTERGLTVADVDLFEINETFAAQTLATLQQLKIDEKKVNNSGGALALGNPVAATGARMAVHLAHQLSRSSARRAVAASSCGGGQGVAIMFEKV